MEKRKKIIDALNHKSGPVPHQINYTEAYVDFINQKNKEKVDPDELFDNQINLVKYKKYKAFKNNLEADLFGVKWSKNHNDGGDIGLPLDPPIVNTEIKPDGSYYNYTMPEPDLNFAVSQAKILENDKTGRFGMFGITFTMYERAWILRGMENVLMDFINEPKFMHHLLGQITDHHLKILDVVLDYDFDAVYFADDWGSQHGLIMGPEIWRTFIRPCIKKLVEKVKSKGKYVILHSCGNNYDIIGDWIDIGIDCYNTVQPEIYDLKKLKLEFGKHLTFYGGISNQQFLPYVSAAEVKKHCLEVLDIMAPGGGYILSPTHNLTPDIPIDNAMAILEAAKEYGH